MNISKENRNPNKRRKKLEPKVTQPSPFLADFIASKLKNYIEPQRQGTPRGEAIGLSKTKFHASLLMMTNQKKKDIARGIKGSYGLLRKWNTEKNFKSTIREHCREFAPIYYHHLQEINASREKQDLEKWEKMSLDDFSKMRFDHKEFLFVDELKEVEYFGRPLMQALLEVIDEKEKRNGFENQPFILFIKYRISMALHGDKKSKKEKDRSVNRVIVDLVGDIVPFILQPSMTDEQKKIVLFFLKGIESIAG